MVKTGLENDVGLTTPVRYAGVVTEADCDFVERARVGLTGAVWIATFADVGVRYRSLPER